MAHAATNEVTIRPLAPVEGDELDRLHRGFLAAFSDYSVPMAISREALAAMIAARGLDPALSRVAVADGEIVAFWLSGTEPESRIATDIATGVAPSHRRQGLAARLWSEVEPALVGAGFTECTLEVIQENARAIPLYERLGFLPLRDLEVYVLPPSSRDLPVPDDVAIGAEPAFDPRAAERWWDWDPAWPGRTRVVERAGGDALRIVARRDGTVVGYAALLRSSANLAQIAVEPGQRRRGIGRALLATAAWALPEGTPLRMLNVPAEDAAGATAAFLHAVGGEVKVRQHEMVKTLG